MSKPIPLGFEFVKFDEKETDTHRIKITSAPFEGVIYEYLDVDFVAESDHLRLKFGTTTHETNGHDVCTPAFTQVVGDILGYLLDYHFPEPTE